MKRRGMALGLAALMTVLLYLPQLRRQKTR